MSNSYFRFKQFIIQQDCCAMKVCTDSCILGAWFAQKDFQPAAVLDIGAGTGLLMLMLAQKKTASIDGIELDGSCYTQLEQNIGQNDWKERMHVYQGDVRSHSFPAKYDFIITNPPFFEHDLPSQTDNQKLAKHSPELTLRELIEVIDRNLSDDGSFGILLPFDRWQYFNSLGSQWRFHLHETLFIRHNSSHSFSRAVLYYSRNKKPDSISFELSIHEGKTQIYTGEFVALMKDYYLYL